MRDAGTGRRQQIETIGTTAATRPAPSGRSVRSDVRPTARALIFDLGGTLLVDSPDREEARRLARQRLVREALAAAGRVYPEGRIAASVESLNDAFYQLHAAGEDISSAEAVELLLDFVEPALATRLSSKALETIEEALIARDTDSPPRPATGALEVLELARRRRLRLGLVSNTGMAPGYVLRELLSAHGMLQYFDVLTFSDEARLAKPAAAVFECTLGALGVPAERAVFIGDTPLADVAGPRAVGMWTVQIGPARKEGVRPHARIEGLDGLFPALRKLNLVRR